jgi:hypothetical protein
MIRRNSAATTIEFDSAASHARLARSLREEAAALESRFGPNLYSTFLRTQGRRPDREQAAVIGRLLRAQVKASDGSLQPQSSGPDLRVGKIAKKQDREDLIRRTRAVRTKRAINDLSTITNEPVEVLAYVKSSFELAGIREQVRAAVNWLNRFAEECDRRGQCKLDDT